MEKRAERENEGGTLPSTKPECSPLEALLQDVLGQYRRVHDGEVASYIPELGKTNPDHFGVCIATVDGEIYEAGDCDVEFTIQCTSKALVYAAALSSHGREEISARVGIEPSGDAFNSIQLDKLNRAFNPMVNAGAISNTGFISGASLEERRAKLLKLLSDAVGRELSIDDQVYRSVSQTGHRNRAHAWLLTNFDKMDPATNMETLELYFMQCWILVTARDLAVMGATLANTGTPPPHRRKCF